MKNDTPEKQLTELCSQLTHERATWNHINENGCNDPFWPDGCNMNLTRNHIISYKRDIAELCEKAGMSLPEEYFLKIPPEVDDNETDLECGQGCTGGFERVAPGIGRDQNERQNNRKRT